jgi:hypothetical protein
MSLVMTASSKQVSVTTTPVKIWDFDATRVQGEIACTSAAFYVGGSDLSSSNGYKVGSVLPIPATGAQAEMWAAAVSGTITVSALEFKVL